MLGEKPGFHPHYVNDNPARYTLTESGIPTVQHHEIALGQNGLILVPH